MRALVLLCINQYTKFEVPSFTNYKDIIGAKLKKTTCLTLTTPLFGVVCHRRLGFDTVYLRENLTILASVVPEISLGRQNLKWVTRP